MGPPERFLSALLVVCAVAASGVSAAGSSDPGTCIDFVSPRRGEIVPTPSCTILVKTCPVVQAIDLHAQYLGEDGQSKHSVQLVSMNRPPFKYTWNTSDIPNQYLVGATIVAVASFLNGETKTQRQGGVFLQHHPIQRPTVDVSRLNRLGGEGSHQQLTLSGKSERGSSHARVYWDHHNLVVAVTVSDSTYHSELPETVRRMSGCEILIDASQQPHPYPSDSVFALRVPLAGPPIQRHYSPTLANDGGFSIDARTSAYKHNCTIKAADSVGWKAICIIPPKLIGRPLPQTVRCNIVARLVSEDSSIAVMSWTGETSQQMYSPTTWGSLILKGKPITQNPWFLGAIGVIAGMLVVFVGYPVFTRLHKISGLVLTFETPEGERKIADMVRAFIDSKVPDKTTTLEVVANEFSLETKHLDLLIRKYAGKPFHRYLLGLRLEVAKERLRSSNATEATVAELCGFKNVEDMQNVFLKYAHMTPYKFRLENQVS